MQALLHSLRFSPCVVSLRGNLAHLQVAEVRRHSMSHGERRNSVGVCVPLAATKKGSETLAVLLKDLPKKIVQKTVLEKEPAPAMGTKWKVGKVRRQLVVGGDCGSVAKEFPAAGRIRLVGVPNKKAGGQRGRCKIWWSVRCSLMEGSAHGEGGSSCQEQRIVRHHWCSAAQGRRRLSGTAGFGERRCWSGFPMWQKGGSRQLDPKPGSVLALLVFPCLCRFPAGFLTGARTGPLMGWRAQRWPTRQISARRWYVSGRHVTTVPGPR